MYGENIPFPRDLRHALSLAKQYTDETQLARYDTKSASIPLKETSETFIPSNFGTFYNHSHLCPRKSDLENGTIAITDENGNVYSVVPTDILVTDNYLACYLEAPGFGNPIVAVFVAYKEGETTIDLGFGDETFNIPKVGIYTLPFSSSASILNIKWETIHPIDPKFLPSNVINLADYGLSLFDTEKYSATLTKAQFEELFALYGTGRAVVCEDDGVIKTLFAPSRTEFEPPDGGVFGAQLCIPIEGEGEYGVILMGGTGEDGAEAYALAIQHFE